MKQLLLTLILFTLFTAQGMAKSKSIADASIGCTTSAYVSKLYQYAHEKDTDAFKSAFLSGISQGMCTKFRKGEKVVVIGTNVSAGQAKVRRAGDETEEYWVIMESVK